MKVTYYISIIALSSFAIKADDFQRYDKDIRGDARRLEQEFKRGYTRVKTDIEDIAQRIREEWDHLFEHQRLLNQHLAELHNEHIVVVRTEEHLKEKAKVSTSLDESNRIQKSQTKIKTLRAHLERVTRDAKAHIKKLDDHIADEAHKAHVKVDQILHDIKNK